MIFIVNEEYQLPRYKCPFRTTAARIYADSSSLGLKAVCVKITTKAQHCRLHTHPFNGPFPWQHRWAGTRKVKPIWILLKQQTASGSGISWAIGKSAPCSRQITTPAPHHSVFYRTDALPAAQPTASKHWRHIANCTWKHCLLYATT